MIVTKASTSSAPTTGFPVPHSLVVTHRMAAGFGVANMVMAGFWLLLGTQIDIGSASLWGYAGELLVALGILVNVWAMVAPLRHSALTESSQPQTRIWAAPGASWAYANNFGGEVSFNMINQLPTSIRLGLVAWRSVRLVLICIACTVINIGGLAIVFSALNLGLIEL